MENGFEKYLYENRDKLESRTPSPQVWQRLQEQLIKHHQKRVRIVRIWRIGLAAAASVLLLSAIGYFALRPKEAAPQIADTGQNLPKPTESAHEKKTIAKPGNKTNGSFTATEQETRQSLFYYARLIQIRQNQIKRLQGFDPDLYNESQKSITDLNKIYHQLQAQLSGSINQERVLEEMIENLQMQEKILNNQLQLLKGLPPSNKNNDEKTVKEI